MKAGIILIFFGLLLAGGMAALYFYLGKTKEQKTPPQDEVQDPLQDYPQYFKCESPPYKENGDWVFPPDVSCIIGHHTGCYKGKCIVVKTH